MKVKLSYYYNLRYFKFNQIPVATTVSMPPYFRINNFYKNTQVFYGIRDTDFVPSRQLEGLCNGHETCKNSPDSCLFLQKYYEQISKLNKDEVFNKFEKIVQTVESKLGRSIISPEIILIVYEAYIGKNGDTNPCSEAWMIKRLFKDWGCPLEDFSTKSIEEEKLQKLKDSYEF